VRVRKGSYMYWLVFRSSVFKSSQRREEKHYLNFASGRNLSEVGTGTNPPIGGRELSAALYSQPPIGRETNGRPEVQRRGDIW
jgi:hypothetical protein